MGLKGINHLVLKVRNLVAADQFYREVLGMQKVGERGRMYFYHAGGHHHDLALLEVGTQEEPPARGVTGLLHFCLDVSDEASLAQLYRQCRAAGVQILGTADHTVSRGFYVADPDGHVVELGVDTPRAQWADVPAPFAHDKEYVLPV